MHRANAIPNGGAGCCSGIKVWNWDVCLAVYHAAGSLNGDACDSFGDIPAQRFSLNNGSLAWQDGSDSWCIVPQVSKETKGTTRPLQGQKKAAFKNGASCTAKVQMQDDPASGGFRVVLPGKQELCLSSPEAADAEGARAQRLAFRPCEEAAKDETTFFQHRDNADGRLQVRGRFGLCIDAASGAGPIAYECHNPELSDPNQLFGVKGGDIMRWDATKLDGGLLCLGVEGDDGGEVVPFAPCTTAAEAAVDPSIEAARADAEEASKQAPKPGQGFVQVAKHQGGFGLREVLPLGDLRRDEPPRCLALGTREGESVVLVAPCDESDAQRWEFVPRPGPGQHGVGAIKSAAHDMCLDNGASRGPLLYNCYDAPDFLSQRWLLLGNGWIQAPRWWADNGRIRLPERCLDSRPHQPLDLVAADCDRAAQDGVVWDEIWAETPLETRLFQQAKAARESKR